jgi:hypothetical protein
MELLERDKKSMPDIKFFETARPTRDYTWASSTASKSIRFGGYEFILTKTEALDGPINRAGQWGFIGYETTYTNTEISQEETDRFWQKYLEDTGQAG